MGVQERKERDKENLRQAILDAAEKLFVKEGFENVSMRKIAKKIEYSPTTIYLYFQDKADLFSCLFKEAFSELQQTINESYKGVQDDPIACIRKGMRAYIEFGLKHPNYYKLIFMSDFSQITTRIDDSSGRETLFSLQTYIEMGIRQGLFRNIDVDLATKLVWTMNHGITSLLITLTDFPWIDDKEGLIDMVINTAIKGLTI
jgi:AcrR family transcriptional regulator